MEIQYVGREQWTQAAQSLIQPTVKTHVISTFTEFIADLEPWESDLLQHTELFLDPYSISVALSHGVRVVSDGSEKYGTHGAFGWMLSDDRGERMATGMGPARGATASAFRAEAFGMLAVTLFLARLGDFTGHFDDWNGVIATDSQSVLDTIQQSIEVPNPTSQESMRLYQGEWKTLDVMSADWDVLIELQESLKKLPGMKLQHVRGHQDLHTPYRNLSLLAQLNVDADHQASKYQCIHGAIRPYVFLMPHTRVHILTQAGTITSHHEATLRQAATREPLLQHIATKNHWSSSVMRTINWEAHGQALRKNLHRRVHYTNWSMTFCR